ncbi:MAG TPA: PilZ domain-containing protein [Thermoanaerobaculia bacterium]|nr:PilZ domain-containing protein [Thermoanaerobaculia bacterium]
MGVLDLLEFAAMKERRKATRYETPSIPVQLSDIDGQMIDLSLSGAAVVHRSPIKPGTPCTLIFPSYGGIYVPCQVLRSVVQVRESDRGSEYVFRSAISFLPMEASEKTELLDFLRQQIERLEKVRADHQAMIEQDRRTGADSS